MGSTSPAGYNEGVVAGFTSGLQDGYYAGFQAGRLGSTRYQPQQQTGLSNTFSPYSNDGKNIPNSLPSALPHVSPGGPLPEHLYEAQAAALQAYQSNFQSQNFNREDPDISTESSQSDEDKDSSDAKSLPDIIEDEPVDEELIEELKSKQARLLDQQAVEQKSNTSSPNTTQENQNSQVTDSTQSRLEEDEYQIEENTKIASMDLMTAVIVFSGTL